MSKEAMKLALETVEYIEHNYMSLPAPATKAITAVREALAEQPAQQEPVAKPKLIGWRTSDYLMETSDVDKAKNWEVHYEMLPIFEGDPHTKLAAPQPAQRTWVGLTDEEIQTEWVLTPQNDRAEGIWFGRRIEAKLKEKNNG